MGQLPEGMEPYLAHDKFIQRDAPEIADAIDTIDSRGPYKDEMSLARAGLSWNRFHLRYGRPSDISDAVKASNGLVTKCIGRTYLPADILRKKGIPTRTVRVFMARGSYVSGYYILELYFPEGEAWGQL